MNPLVSICIPTRGNLSGLGKTIKSFQDTAHDPTRVEFILKFDDDEPSGLLFHDLPGFKVVFSPRGQGYIEMPRFAAECFAIAKGTWCVLTDDDVWIEGQGWDEQLAQITPERRCAQCEFYQLGQSLYGERKGDPNGLFVPREIAEQLKPQAGPADQYLYDLSVAKGYQVVWLRGIKYCHDGRPRTQYR